MSLWLCNKCNHLTNIMICPECSSPTEYVNLGGTVEKVTIITSSSKDATISFGNGEIDFDNPIYWVDNE